MERAKAEGWRFLSLTPDKIESLTPREFTILMRAQNEKNSDDLEAKAYLALMIESAHRTKRPKLSDLYKRPTDADKAKKKAEDLLKQNRHASEWLSQFNFGEATERR